MAYVRATLPAAPPVTADPKTECKPDDNRTSACGPLAGFVRGIAQQAVELAGQMGESLAGSLSRGDFYAFDTETTGTNRGRHVLWQLAAVRFESFEPVSHLDAVLQITPAQFECAFDSWADRQEMLKRMHLTWERIVQDGIPVADAMGQLHRFLGERPDTAVLGYNVHGIDLPFLQLRSAEVPQLPFPISTERWFDLGAVIKAVQMSASITPWERPWEYFRRVSGAWAKNTYWSVAYVVKQLGLPVDMESLHDAHQDCCVLGMIWENLVKGGLTTERATEWATRLGSSLSEKSVSISV